MPSARQQLKGLFVEGTWNVPTTLTFVDCVEDVALRDGGFFLTFADSGNITTRLVSEWAGYNLSLTLRVVKITASPRVMLTRSDSTPWNLIRMKSSRGIQAAYRLNALSAAIVAAVPGQVTFGSTNKRFNP